MIDEEEESDQLITQLLRAVRRLDPARIRILVTRAEYHTLETYFRRTTGVFYTRFQNIPYEIVDETPVEPPLLQSLGEV